MSVTEIIIKIVGVILVLLGLGLISTAFGFPIMVALNFVNPVISVISGIVCIGFGVYIIRGGVPTL